MTEAAFILEQGNHSELQVALIMRQVGYGGIKIIDLACRFGEFNCWQRLRLSQTGASSIEQQVAVTVKAKGGSHVTLVRS